MEKISKLANLDAGAINELKALMPTDTESLQNGLVIASLAVTLCLSYMKEAEQEKAGVSVGLFLTTNCPAYFPILLKAFELFENLAGTPVTLN